MFKVSYVFTSLHKGMGAQSTSYLQKQNQKREMMVNVCLFAIRDHFRFHIDALRYIIIEISFHASFHMYRKIVFLFIYFISFPAIFQ